MASTRPPTSGESGSRGDRAPRSARTYSSTAAHRPSTSPNWCCTVPHVAPASLATELALADSGPPSARQWSAARNRCSRVSSPRLFRRVPFALSVISRPVRSHQAEAGAVAGDEGLDLLGRLVRQSPDDLGRAGLLPGGEVVGRRLDGDEDRDLRPPVPAGRRPRLSQC